MSRDNVLGGVKYLKFLLDYYQNDYVRTIAAYNAGEAAVDKYNGIPPYNETRNYVSRVAQNLKTARASRISTAKAEADAQPRLRTTGKHISGSKRLLAQTAGSITGPHRNFMNRRLWRTAAIFLGLPAFAAPNSGIIQVTGVHSWTHPDFTRVMFDTSGPFEVHSERAFNPDRIFFDVSHARPWIDGHRYATQAINDALIRRVRVAETVPGTTRIVFDLNVAASFRMIRLDHPDRMVIEIRAMHPGAPPTPPSVTTTRTPGPAPLPYVPAAGLSAPQSFPYPPRISARPRYISLLASDNAPSLDPMPLTVFSFPDSAFRLSQIRPRKTSSGLIVRTNPPPAPFTPTPSAPPPVATMPKPIPYDATPKASENATRSLTRALGLKINRIVIDAGHGGHDYGTIGPNGVLEKDVVLDVSLRLAKLVETRMGAEVVLTRPDDTFIPLQERTAIANSRKADLFLSIHANSSPAPSVAGTETFC